MGYFKTCKDLTITDFHVGRLKLAREALRVEVLQNDLRKKAVENNKTSAFSNRNKIRMIKIIQLQHNAL